MSAIVKSASKSVSGDRLRRLTLQVTSGALTTVHGVARAQLDLGDATTFYDGWEQPTAIVVDGPYGVSGFPGDLRTAQGLAEWYAPHAAAWARRATAETSLWFWGTELSWATVHPVLELHGWDYRTAHVWNKGLAHIAGNVNGATIRRFPIATELCVHYTRRVELRTGHGELLPMREWLRAEWLRTGLPLYRTNEAAGVKNAATRKYFTTCHLWYFPPSEVMERLAFYARRHGKRTKHPYFSLDGRTQLRAEQWARMRSKWHHEHGVTNVWDESPVHGSERIKDESGKYVHANQKPLRLVELSIRATTDPGDVVWEPFAGLATAGVAAHRLRRRYFGAEIAEATHAAASRRLAEEGARVDTAAHGDGANRANSSHTRHPAQGQAARA